MRGFEGEQALSNSIEFLGENDLAVLQQQLLDWQEGLRNRLENLQLDIDDITAQQGQPGLEDKQREMKTLEDRIQEISTRLSEVAQKREGKSL